MDITNADQLRQAGRLDEAAAAYRAVLAHNPGQVDALHHLGVIARLRGRLNEADEFSARALQLRPDDASLITERGETMRQCGRFDEARQHFERAAELDPGQAVHFVNLARLHENIGEWDSAVGFISQALDIDPSNLSALERYLNLCNRIGCFDVANRAFKKALRLQPKHTLLRKTYAQLLFHFGDPDDAEFEIEDALEQLPDDAVLHFLLGELQFRRGDEDSALHSLRRATELDPSIAVHQNSRFVCARIATLRDAAVAAGSEIIVTLPAHTIELPTPAVIPEASQHHWAQRAVRIPDAFVTTLRNCELLAFGFVVLSNAGELLLDGLTTSPGLFPAKKGCVAYWAQDRRVLLDLAPSAPRYEQPCALIGPSNNHFHFALEGLPRIGSLRAAGLSDVPIVIPANLHPPQLDMLARLGYDHSKLIMLDEFGSAQFTQLHVPSLLSRGYALTAFGVHFLREFLRLIPPRKDLPKRIYISRNKFGRRKIANEDEFLPLLEANGFVTFYPEQMTFEEQVQLFNNASAILSLEGSAMVNLVFAEPGTHVGLINPAGLHVPHYYFISGHLGHQFTYLESQPLPNTHLLLTHQDMRLKPEILRQWLEQIDPAPRT